VRSHQVWLTLAISLFALWIAKPFLTPIAWAAVIAIAEWPLYRWALRRYPGKSGWIVAALTVATAFLVIGPFSVIATALVAESDTALGWARSVEQHGLPAPVWLPQVPLVGERMAEWWQAHVSRPEAARALLGWATTGSVLSWAKLIAGEIVRESGLFIVTLLALASLLLSGESIARHAHVVAVRTLGEFGEDFLDKLSHAVRRTVLGTVAVSVIEGSLIGAAYFIAGVPQPLLFAVATVVLALIPFGAWAAFGLAGLILIAQGSFLAGALVIVFGVAVMTIGDNLIQPAIIGGAAELPFLLAFVGAFGGLASIGLVGLFIGPVVMVALMLVWREWTEREAVTPSAQPPIEP
jgi:predicted PurR-regulated permease PerM